MAIFGIDTSKPASQELIDVAAQRLVGGDTPKFWGRYFNGADEMKHQYQNSENTVLAGVGIPVLCWARQMTYVGDYAADAADHATKNMQGVIDAFGAQYLYNNHLVPRLYLDVETDDHDYYVLSQAYYKNWSARIMLGLTAGGHTIRFRPAVYLNLRNSRKSVLALNAACAAGAVCDGVWPAHYVHENPTGGPPLDTTKENENTPPPKSDHMTWQNEEPTHDIARQSGCEHLTLIDALQHDPFPPGQPDQHIPKLGWQYFGDYPKTDPDGDVDFNMVNPAFGNFVMQGTVMPPLHELA